MKKFYNKPEIELIDLTSKDALMLTENGYPAPGDLKDDYWLDATSKKGYEDDDYVWG